MGEGSFGRLVSDGTYGTLFDQNRRRFEAGWGRPWRRAVGRGEEPYRARAPRARGAGGRIPARHGRRREPRRRRAARPGTRDHVALPRAADGTWAGHYPADAQAAVEQVEAVRRAGAAYLLLPEPAFWWLDHYAGLADHLRTFGEETVRTSDRGSTGCSIRPCTIPPRLAAWRRSDMSAGTLGGSAR